MLDVLIFTHLYFHRPGTLHDFRSHEIADQLTLLDAELFYKIEVLFVLCRSSHSITRPLRSSGVSDMFFLSVCRSLRSFSGQRNRTKRRVPIWPSSLSTSTTCHTGIMIWFLSFCMGRKLAKFNSNLFILRVRSLIIQQEKAQDREKLLLKFIKIMKVFTYPN